MDRPHLDATERLSRSQLEALQLEKLRQLLEPVAKNPFYQAKLRAAGLERPADLLDLDGLKQLPFTTKTELSADQAAHPPYGTNLTFGGEAYIRIHQTSGTSGHPLRWLDTEASWHWWGQCWAAVYRAAGVGAQDRIFFAFSFGPFIGFWSAHEGARAIGALAVPGGGMSSLQRLRAILANDISVLVCTPTYALHLGEVAAAAGLDLAASRVRTTIHAGEPGAGLPATRARIEQVWGAKCFDHAGATEVGAWGFSCSSREGLHINEAEFIAEIIDPATGAPAQEGELVLTNLGRVGMPVLRYRTGDRARWLEAPCACGRSFRRLAGGVIGRLDDALIVRGVNVYPSAIENIVRAFEPVVEFAVDLRREGALDELEIRLELVGGQADAVCRGVADQVRELLGLRVDVKVVERGVLPRFELKARRFVDHRK